MEKDYRSLEQKIRHLWITEAEARNTRLRKRVTNVARPDTASDPTDVSSKIAKQGEIKTKIIDEADGSSFADPKDKKNDMKIEKKSSNNLDSVDARQIKGGKTEVILDPKTDDRPEEQSMEDAKSKKATNQENKKIGAKSGVKEEVDLDEAGRVLPDLSKSEPKPQHSKEYQARIDREKAKRKQSREDLKSWNQFKFELFRKRREQKEKEQSSTHKEEVDVDQKEQTNTTIGVKEQRMTKLTFGLPESLIDTVRQVVESKKMKGVCPKCGKNPCVCESMKEELKGNQKKLDKNHNGKLDADDFKKLRKEEVEQIDEISDKTLQSYREKSHKDRKPREWGRSMAFAKQTGIGAKVKAVQREEIDFSEEEVEQIEEKKVDVYKAMKARYGDDFKKKKPEAEKPTEKKMAKEDVEQIDELSKGTLGSYVGKAANANYGKEKLEREKGVNLAMKKIVGRGVKVRGTNEDVEFSEEELARIEEIAKGLE